LPKCPAVSFHNKAPEYIPEALWPALGPILEQIGSLTQRIRDYNRQLQTIAEEHYPETELLGQVEGIGTLTALTFVLTLEDPYRFEKSRSVGAYLGLVPATDQSGDRDPQRRITKEGDEMLRRLLVGSAHYVLGPFAKEDSDLRRHGEKIASRGAKRTPRNERRWPWGPQTLGALAPPVGNRRDLRATLQRASAWRFGGLEREREPRWSSEPLERGGEDPGTAATLR
jgi:transposase